MQRQLNLVIKLLQPSFISGLVVMVVTLGLVGSIIFKTNFKGSGIQSDILYAQNAPVRIEEARQVGDSFTDKLTSNRAYQNIPVVLFWGFVGLIVYSILTSIIAVHKNISLARRELTYVNADRKRLLRTAYIRMTIRVIALITWFVYYKLFFDRLLPYIFDVTRIGAALVPMLTGLEYCVLGFVVCLLSIHLHVIFVRLCLVRVRVFGGLTPGLK